ncbi:retrotransposon protein, putative, ty1-copia subclass [Tanacetum coccineum]
MGVIANASTRRRLLVKKFVVAVFWDYKMVESKSVVSQVNDLQVLLHDIHAEGMTLSENFSVDCYYEKYLKLEDNKLAQKDSYTPDSAKANMVEHAGSSSRFNSKGNKKDKKKNDKKGKGKLSHRAANCKMPKRVNPRQANMVDENVGLIAMVSVTSVPLISGLTCKDKAIDKFVLYKTEVKNQLGRKIKVIRSDRGGEYVSPFAELCVKHEIRHEFTAPYSPQQNDIAERKNRTLKEMVNAMLINFGLIQDMWGEAILTATYLLNKIPLLIVSLYMKNPDIQKNVVMESKNASFFENIFSCLTKETGSSSRLDDEVVQDKIQRDDNNLHDERQDQLEEEEVEPRRSKRARTEKSFGPDFVSFMVENEPTSYQEAELVDLSPSCKPLGYKWIFKKKMKANGTINKYKARLVIKGFRQREGLDYFDTYSPVTRITSIRMILAIAALRKLEVHQIDVKTTFLNEDLEEEIYMNQPEVL